MSLDNPNLTIYNKEIASLSVIIPTKNREESLLECLNSLFKQDYFPKEVIIIDQSLDDKTYQKLKLLIPQEVRLIYIHNRFISGLTQAKNIGIDRASGDLILFLDDDIIIINNNIKNMLNVFTCDTEKNIGGIGGFIVNERPPFYFRFASFFFCGPFAFYNDQSTFQWKVSRGNELMLLSRLIPGGASCIRAEVFKNLRFDETCVGYCFGEDSIFGYMASSRYKLFLYSGFKFFHKRISSPRDDKGKNIRMQIIWWFYFFYKYVPKTLFNSICFLWLNIGILLKVAIESYESSVIKGYIESMLIIISVLLKKNKIEDIVAENLS